VKKAESKLKITELPTHLAEPRFNNFDPDDPVIRDIVSVQGRMRSKLGKIKQVHELRMGNAIEAPLANLAASKSHAEKELAQTLPFVDQQRKKTRDAIAALEKEIDESLDKGASRWQFAEETRQHVKQLSQKDREKFVETALRDGDQLAAAAVLGVPPYLSGLNKSAHKLFLSRYRSECFPESSARIKALSDAQDILDKGGMAFMSEVEQLFRNADISGAEAHAERLRRLEASE
jgi:hypothetical protein